MRVGLHAAAVALRSSGPCAARHTTASRKHSRVKGLFRSYQPHNQRQFCLTCFVCFCVVAVRVRPAIAEDVENVAVLGPFEDCTCVGSDSRSVSLRKWVNDTREFRFDRVLAPEVPQADMYELVGRDIVNVRCYCGWLFKRCCVRGSDYFGC